jgi:hypothetical protein
MEFCCKEEQKNLAAVCKKGLRGPFFNTEEITPCSLADGNKLTEGIAGVGGGGQNRYSSILEKVGSSAPLKDWL